MSPATTEASLFKAQCSNLSLDALKERKTSLKKYLIHTAVKWKLLQVRWPLIGKCSNSTSLAHIVKGGETLTSIARHYGVSILEILAENDNLVDIDFVMKGERISIPARSGKLQMDSNKLYNPTLDRWIHISNIKWTRETQEALSKPPPSCGSQNASPTGFDLVLVPLVTLCILFMIKALLCRAMKKTKHQEPDVSQEPRYGIQTDRWRNILDGPMSSDSDTPPGEDDYVPSEEDPSPASSKEMSHEYKKLEFAYQKFLSECGMSKSGYFRGGAPD